MNYDIRSARLHGARHSWRGAAAIAAAALSAPALAQPASIAVRVLPGSAFTDNGCNDPCVCIIAPIPQPIGGRFYFAPAPSIPGMSAMQGHFRVETLGPSPIVLSGVSNYTLTMDPAALERLRVTTSYASREWDLEDLRVIQDGGLPALRMAVSSAQFECTTLHMDLRFEQICAADFSNALGTGVPDAAITIEDLLYFLGAFEGRAPWADLDDGSRLGYPDGAVNVDDLLFYLEKFESGC